MAIKTVKPDREGKVKDVKEHIVIVEENRFGWVTTSCGHEHFEPPIKEYDSIDDVNEEDICQNCLGPRKESLKAQ
jgi:hypothetical protein